MSGKANNAGIYNFGNLNAQTLYIKGRRFEDYITELVFEDQLEQSEIDEVKLLLQYLNTSGLSSEWIIDNNNKNQDLKSAITLLQTKLANIDTTALTEPSVLTNDNRNSVLKTAIDAASTDLTSLSNRVVTAETDIDNLETRMTTAETDIDNLETRMTTAEADIDALETSVATADTNITNLQTKTQYLNAPLTTNGGQTSYFTNGLQVWNGANEAGNGIFSYQNDHTPINQIELRALPDKHIKLSGGGIDLVPASQKTVSVNNGDGRFTFQVGDQNQVGYSTRSIIRLNGDIELNGDGTETGISIYREEASGFDPLKRNVDIRAADAVRIFAHNPYMEADDGASISLTRDLTLRVPGGDSPGTISIQVTGDTELNENGQINIGTEQDQTALGYTEITIGQTTLLGRNSSTFLDGDTYLPINPLNPEAYDYIMYVGMPTIYSGATHGPIKTTFNPYFRSISTFSVSPTINSFISSSGTFTVGVGLGAITLNAGLGGTIITTVGGACSMTSLIGGINLLTGAGGIAMTTGGGACAITTGGGPIQLQTSSGDIVIDSGSEGLSGSTYITPKEYLILNPQEAIIIGANGNKPIYSSLINTNYTEHYGNLFTTEGDNHIVYSAVFTTGTQFILLRPAATAQILLAEPPAPAEGEEATVTPDGSAFMVIQNTATNAILYVSSTTTITTTTTNATFTFGDVDQVLPNNATLRVGVYVVGTVANYRYRTDQADPAIQGFIGVKVDSVTRPNESSTSHFINVFGDVRFQDQIDTVAEIHLTSESNQNTTTITNNSITTVGAVESNSLVISGNYTGNTDARLYKNTDNKLMWNGTEVAAGGVSSGGITYMINVASNITNPSPTPTEIIMTAAYSGNPQSTITQAITSNSAFYIARYTTEVFDEASNPVLTGLQQLNQYISWNTQAHTGQLYGQLWFQATAAGLATLYQRTYASPVTTTPATVLNGTPIPTPKGLYNIKFQRVVFPNINVVVSSGPVVLRYRVQGLVSGSWTNLYTMVGFAPPTYSSTTNNLTITLDESVTLNQTTVGATALRLVLFIDSGTGTISQTSAGGADLAAYSLIGLGAGTPGLFRTMLYDGTNAKITVPYSTTPTLIEYDLAIDAPYNVSAFPSPTLSTELYFIQPTGGFANHAITLYFNEGTISHYHSTISPIQTAPTLAQVLNSGATASQAINMNTNKISGITTLEGAANGNWNVKEITAAQGSGISVTPTNGSYAIANTGILSISSGTGISVSTSNGVAVITNTDAGSGILENIRDEHQSLYEVGALPRKPDYWATNWSVADSEVRSHHDIYVSVDGKIIASASGSGVAIRYSTDYGTSWNNGNVSFGDLEWSSICGTSNGSKLFAFGTIGTSNNLSLRLYSSTDRGATWTQVTSSAFNIVGINSVNRVRCSGDGKYLLANITNVQAEGRYLFSSDGGVTWVIRNLNTSLLLGYTNGVAMSRSGAVQFITWINDNGTLSKIFRSIDYGANWSEASAHIPDGKWTHIECDATGRFVYATRYVNISTPTVEARRSDNYGIDWYGAGINGMEDIWVSATGQFVCGVSNPQDQGRSYFVYTADYGRSWLGLPNPASSVNNTYRTINGSADGSILVLGSVNFSEGGFAGDGKIRIAREGQQNIQDLQVTGAGTISKANGIYSLILPSTIASEQLIFRGRVNTNAGSYILNWTTGIDLIEYDIRYKIDINYDYLASPSLNPALIELGLNQVRGSSVATGSASFHPVVTNWTNTVNNGSGGVEEFNSSYRHRFYCGYRPPSTYTADYRNRQYLSGVISLNRRESADPGYAQDATGNSYEILNKFTSDHYLLVKNANNNEHYIYSPGVVDTHFQHQRIHGTALWNASGDNQWANNLATGINNITLYFSDEANQEVFYARPAEILYSIYRVNKGVVGSI